MAIRISGRPLAALRQRAARLDLFEAPPTAFDFGEDVLRLGLPDDRLRVAVSGIALTALIVIAWKKFKDVGV
jgi:hypothetical protein